MNIAGMAATLGCGFAYDHTRVLVGHPSGGLGVPGFMPPSPPQGLLVLEGISRKRAHGAWGEQVAVMGVFPTGWAPKA